MKKTRKKFLAVLLTFAMLFSSSLTVIAEEIECKDLNVNAVLTDEDSIVLSKEVNDDYRNSTSQFHSIKIIGASSGEIFIEGLNVTAIYEEYKYKLEVPVPAGKQWTITDKEFVGSTPAATTHIYKYKITVHETDAVPSSNPTKIEEPAHEHSYSWVTVQEAGAGQDGIEEYRCSCGAVAERSIIPASQVFVKGLFGEIKNAPLNGTVTYDTGSLYTMSDYLVKKLAERSDVTVEITFEYEKKPYKMIIPAGVDYAALLEDDENFYGYFYFAKVTGATIEER